MDAKVGKAAEGTRTRGDSSLPPASAPENGDVGAAALSPENEGALPNKNGFSPQSEDALSIKDALPVEEEEALGRYLAALAIERNASRETVRSYRADMRAYLDWCARNHVDALHPSRRALRAYLGSLSAAGYAHTTINRHLSAVKGFFGWLLTAGLMKDDPTTMLSGLKKEKRLPRKIPASELLAIFTVHGVKDVTGRQRAQTPQDYRDQAVLELMYASGCRISEISRLCVDDLDFPKRQVLLFGKGKKERIVPVHDIAVDSLRAYLSLGRPALLQPDSPQNLFFLSNRGKRYSEDLIRRMFTRTVLEAGVDGGYTPHDMRHTFASDLLEGGADLRSVQELLGHESPSTTQIYTHLSPDYLRKAHARAHPRG